MAEQTFRLSETAMAARRQREFLDGDKKSIRDEVDHLKVGRVANAMMDFRAEHINEPLSRLWARLAQVALTTE